MRLGLHLIVLRLCCQAACELWTALRSSSERSAARSSQAVKQHGRSAIRCSPSLTKRPPAGRTGGFLGARAALAVASVRMRDGAATRRRLLRHREPRSTSFWSAACPLSPAGHCAARGPRAHHRVDQLADWPRSAVRFIYISELSYALFARARESFELCSHFKSLPPVAPRDLPTNVTWRAHRRKAEKAPRRPRPRIGRVLGEGGDTTRGVTRAYKTRSRRTKTALFVGKPRYHQSWTLTFKSRPENGKVRMPIDAAMLLGCIWVPQPCLDA